LFVLFKLGNRQVAFDDHHIIEVELFLSIDFDQSKVGIIMQLYEGIASVKFL